MKYFQEITLLPDTNNSLSDLWKNVFQQIHIALVDNKVAKNSSAIGLSIPEYFIPNAGDNKFPLGTKIRLFAESKTELEQLNITHWLHKYDDNTHVKSVNEVPSDIDKYVCFTRKHVNGQKRIAKKVEDKAKYQSEKFNLPYDECLKRIGEKAPKPLSLLPFVRVTSLSNEDKIEGSYFPFFIEMQLQDKPSINSFTCYGLSNKQQGRIATVPWF